MTKDLTKVALRRQSIKRWRRGIKESLGIEEPTDKEIHSFVAGFNMGYEAYKTKRFKE